MVMLNNPLDFSPQYQQLKKDYQNLCDKFSERIAELSELRSTIMPNIETDYMLKIGSKEHQLFSLQVQMQQLKREISLWQAAQNRGEITTESEVKAIIRREFQEYQQQLQEQQQKIELAEKHFGAETMSPEKSKQFRKLYLSLVKKLHPDLHPDLPAIAGNLWNRIQGAWQSNDLPELELLADMTEEMLDQKNFTLLEDDAFSVLQEKVEKLRAKLEPLELHIKELRVVPPLSYLELLRDSGKVLAKRQELERQIKAVQNILDELESRLQEMRGVL